VFGALTQNVNFKCNEAICFGIGLVHEQFKALQTTINFFAVPGRFAPLVVDGFIGNKTITAANAAAQAAGVPAPGTTRQALATSALTFTAQLQSALNTALPQALTVSTAELPAPEINATVQQIVAACRTNKNDPTCTKAAIMCKQVAGTPAAKLVDVAEICGAVRRRSWIWWVVGSVAAVTGVGVVLYHRKRP
jgi:lysozyme family protein